MTEINFELNTDYQKSTWLECQNCGYSAVRITQGRDGKAVVTTYYKHNAETGECPRRNGKRDAETMWFDESYSESTATTLTAMDYQRTAQAITNMSARFHELSPTNAQAAESMREWANQIRATPPTMFWVDEVTWDAKNPRLVDLKNAANISNAITGWTWSE